MKTSAKMMSALALAFATLSSAAAFPSEGALAKRGTSPGGAYCCTWEGCADCTYGTCILNKNTAEGTCPYKGGTGAGPIAAGNSCCSGADCQPCASGDCKVTSFFGSNGICPYPSVGGIVNPGELCKDGDACLFGACILVPTKPFGICPTQGGSSPSLGVGEKCCTDLNCAPCGFGLRCQTLAVPNVGNFPAGTCQFN